MDSSDDDIECWENDELQNYNFLCFMCSDSFTELEMMFEHISNVHKTNLKSIFESANISDEYEWIKFVNFLRKNINTLNTTDITNGIWKSDEYLKPEIPDDNILFIDYKIITNCCENKANSEIDNYKLKILELEKQIVLYETNLSNMRQKITDLLESNAELDEPVKPKQKLTAEDDAYFIGYSHYSIHDIMIKDRVRTESYRKFIEENGLKYFQNKVVLDVGCGTGILSMFAARAGATHVYGVDCADIIYDAMAIVEKNGLKDKVTLIHGKLEEIQLPCQQVDVVISEWMGYFLIYESMLDSVLYACRKYLNPRDGLVFPRYFTLNIVGADLSMFREKNIDCWDSVFGFDMSCMKMNVLKEAAVETIAPEEVMTKVVLLRQYDVQQMAFDDESTCPQVIDQEFKFSVVKTGQLGAIVAYFDTYFLLPTKNDNNDDQVMFSTGPGSTATHWQQTVLFLDKPIDVTEGEIFSGQISVKRHNQGKRGLKFSIVLGETTHQNFEFS